MDQEILWGDKRYHSLDYELKKQYGQKVYKLSLNGQMTCPNRDGTIGQRGCIFCSEGGSGDFAAPPSGSIYEQIEEAKLQVNKKLTKYLIAPKYIAYFQAYTNTYAPIHHLRDIFEQAISHPDILILSIATRPDCLDDEVLLLLDQFNKIKPVWIELGLQTIHEKSAEFIRRGYSLRVFDDAVKKLNDLGIPVIVHTILGLPGESKKDILATIQYLSKMNIQGIKLQLLHILKGTDLGFLYETGQIQDVLTLEEYTDLVIECLEFLPKDLVIHRITGDGPRNLLLAPNWSMDKKKVLNLIQKKQKDNNTWQGKLFQSR